MARRCGRRRRREPGSGLPGCSPVVRLGLDGFGQVRYLQGRRRREAAGTFEPHFPRSRGQVGRQIHARRSQSGRRQCRPAARQGGCRGWRLPGRPRSPPAGAPAQPVIQAGLPWRRASRTSIKVPRRPARTGTAAWVGAEVIVRRRQLAPPGVGERQDRIALRAAVALPLLEAAASALKTISSPARAVKRRRRGRPPAQPLPPGAGRSPCPPRRSAAPGRGCCSAPSPGSQAHRPPPSRRRC